ncbi:hypothetical protein KXW98_009417 [Aspergillus fumigatus]|nr:hypothetical protein KXX10_005846 [Aspergillus fumigatus]KAH1418596.1 hypothetical protein KXX32_009079 [Aspergillus fumigatus]KAH2378388.1 hypothetical protein KXV41_004982 [Aspergillus fumigatus]KAH2409650.1 hypothetical protein KXW64_000538 [Aspergillus fumigatus]KAH3042140.1 hypothetical protein KXW83_007702 [Aspergillus fumigatus]
MTPMGVLRLSFNGGKLWDVYDRKYKFILYLHLLPTPDNANSKTWSTIPYTGLISQYSTKALQQTLKIYETTPEDVLAEDCDEEDDAAEECGAADESAVEEAVNLRIPSQPSDTAAS